MHEMGIATEIVRIVTESIPADMDGCKVARVNLIDSIELEEEEDPHV